MKKQQILNELKKLNLPIDKYAVFGSGPMAIRGIRESNDIDIIVTKDLFDKLKQENLNKLGKTDFGDESIKFNDVEIINIWRDLKIDINILINESELIEDYPFVKLDYVIEWKKNRSKEKDNKDIDLINKFLNKN